MVNMFHVKHLHKFRGKTHTLKMYYYWIYYCVKICTYINMAWTSQTDSAAECSIAIGTQDRRLRAIADASFYDWFLDLGPCFWWWDSNWWWCRIRQSGRASSCVLQSILHGSWASQVHVAGNIMDVFVKRKTKTVLDFRTKWPFYF